MGNPRVCLLTGATDGIGKAAAFELAKESDLQLVLVGRNPNKLENTLQDIRTQTPTAQVDGLLADLSLMGDVRQLTVELGRKYRRLDLLLNNAGSFFMSKTITSEGFESTWALNHLSYFLLTQLCLPLLKGSTPARIVNVASMMHGNTTLHWDNLQGEKKYDGIEAYSRSKLANIMFTYALARRLEGEEIAVNCLHPGGVATNIYSHVPFFLKPLTGLMKLFMSSPAQGAKTLLHLALSEEGGQVSGQYFDTLKARRSSAFSYDEAAQEKLWKISTKQVGLE